jgi:hypothetical protein
MKGSEDEYKQLQLAEPTKLMIVMTMNRWEWE